MNTVLGVILLAAASAAIFGGTVLFTWARIRWHVVSLDTRGEYRIVKSSWRYRPMRDLHRELLLSKISRGIVDHGYGLVATRGAEDVEEELRRTGQLPYPR